MTRRGFLRLIGASSFALALGARRPARPTFAAGDPGGWIVLTRNRDIVMTRPDGSDTKTLLSVGKGEFVFDVALSPDGKRVAYGYFTTPTGTGGGGSDIMLMTIAPDVGAPTMLAARDAAGVLLGAPSWSPDGRSVVFEVVGLSATGQATVRCDTIGVDGSGRQTVVDGGRYPALAPDGQSVAYVKSTTNGDALWIRPIAGGDEHQLVSDADMAAISYPRFSPDGKLIAFSGIDLNSLRPAPRDLELARLDLESSDGVAVDQIGEDDAGALHEAARHGLPTDPWVVSPSGDGLRRVVQLSGDDLAVAWSPDGQWLAVSGAYGLYLFTVADGTERDVSQDGSFGALDWR